MTDFYVKEQDSQMNFSAPLEATMMLVEMFGFRIAWSVHQGTIAQLDLFCQFHVYLAHILTM